MRVRGMDGYITEAWDMCSHLKVGMTAPYYVGEDDCCGPALRYGFCLKCALKNIRQHGGPKRHCDICKKTKPAVGFVKFMHYHAIDDDDYLSVCIKCQKSSQYKDMVKSSKDAEELERELENEEYENWLKGLNNESA